VNFVNFAIFGKWPEARGVEVAFEARGIGTSTKRLTIARSWTDRGSGKGDDSPR